MPNWCDNVLVVTGPKRLRDKFRKEQARVEPSNEPGCKRDRADFSFHQAAPVPPDVDEYNWCCEHWGTKWDVNYPEVCASPNGLTYTFATAWSPPDGWLKTVSEKYPKLLFTLAYREDGCGVNGVTEARAGKLVEVSEDSSAYITYDSASEEADEVQQEAF